MMLYDTLPETEKIAWLRLFMTENVGPATFFQLIGRHGTAEKALSALPDYARRGGRKKALLIPSAADVQKQLDLCDSTGGRLLVYAERAFPAVLRDIADCPPLLFVRGQVSLLRKKAVAIVGTRRASLNNMNYTRLLAQSLGKAGYPIISGLALGIDGAAHEGSIDTGTIAVLAGGLDYIYPPKHTNLFHQIGEKGVLISERPFASPVHAHDFPRRNRIVAGLSAAVIVVEATEGSGSLITARMAKTQDRLVFAVPGSPSDPRAAGTNALIKNGAHLVTGPEDVIAILESQSIQQSLLQDQNADDPWNLWQPMKHVRDEDIDAARTDVLGMLDTTPVAVDQLIRAVGLPPHLVHCVLLELQLAGRLQRHPGNKVCLSGEIQ
jgi:DNA processing protein